MSNYTQIKDGRSIKDGRLYCREITTFPLIVLGIINIKWHFGVGVHKMDDNGKLHKAIIDLADGRGIFPFKENSFKEFASGHIVYEISDTNSEQCRSLQEVSQIALSHLGKRGVYSVFKFNCAQFAYYCKLSEYKSIASVPNCIGQ